MANIIASNRCTKCQTLFCTKHIVEDQKDLPSEFERLMIEHNNTLQEIFDKEKENESSMKLILSQIDLWENNMIERVRDKGNRAREQLVQLMGNEKKLAVENAQDLIKEVRERSEAKESLENDVERLKQSLVKLKAALKKLTQQSEVELYIEPNYMIDWNHLIYARRKSETATSSVVNKQISDKNNKGVKNTIGVNPQCASLLSSSKFSSVDESDSTGTDCIKRYAVRSLNAGANNITKKAPLPPPLERQPTLLTSSNILSPSLLEKKRRMPLTNVDPVSHKCLKVDISNPPPTINRISSQATSVIDTTSAASSDLTSAFSKTQLQEDFRQKVAQLFTGWHKT